MKHLYLEICDRFFTVIIKLPGAELVNLKGFAFKQHPKINVDKERLDLLSETVNEQIGRILA